MVGSRTGVATRLKSLNSFIVSVHCIAHRLALACSQAADSVLYLLRYQRVLRSIYTYFSSSSTCSSHLRRVQAVLDDPVLQYKQLHTVRWLLLDGAVEAVYRTLNSLIITFESEAAELGYPTARAIASSLQEYKFLATTCDVLPHLSNLSRVFQ